MYNAKSVLTAAMAASLASLAPSVAAHGEAHGKPKATGYSKQAEMPFGRAGEPKKVDRAIHVGMHDTMRFVAAAPHERTTDVRPGNPPHSMPADIVLKKGETVRFIVRNGGRVMHEMVIGTMKELKEHAELMRRFPTMEHEEAYMAHVAPGKEGEIVWQFTQAGEFHYACLVPGHMEAGMLAKITVK